MTFLVFAASTQRTIGYVIAALAMAGFIGYWLFNWLSAEGKAEIGAEIELAANRRPHMSDDDMETKRLDLSLAAGLATLAIVAITLPLYWLGEPGRHQGNIDFRTQEAINRGESLYEENCAQCHGSVDGGGLRDFTILDASGVYIEDVEWKVPSLAAVLDRFSEDEVRYILNYGRSNSPMPAWGGPGGGPMTSQQIDNVIAYLAHEQLPSEEIAQQVVDGVGQAALVKAQADNPALMGELFEVEEAIAAGTDAGDNVDTLRTRQAEINKELADLADEIEKDAADDPVLMGELLFNNPVAGGAYNCARCHSSGWSYDADQFSDGVGSDDNLLVPPVIPGGGGFGPNLTGDSTERQFTTAELQAGFIVQGTVDGQKYGNFGQGDGGGQMPGFGQCWADTDAGERDRLFGHCDGRTGMLTDEQIDAIVAYERGL